MENKFIADPVRLLKELKKRPEEYWIKRGERRALQLFHAMAMRVPAYKDFLKKNGVAAGKVKTIKDFPFLPTVDKDNYLRAYPLEKLMWDGKLSSKQVVYASTSGSTGEPFYFPREKWQDMQYALLAEMYLRDNFQIQNRSTLYINGFAMGAWIGGVFTYEAVKMVAERGGYDLSIISPGIYKKEILKAVKKFGKLYDQLIIAGYPPFIKDTIDVGAQEGITWSDYQLGFVFSAEGFSEEFREYILKKTGGEEYYRFSLNHYGTVDLGTMAHETPLSIAIRKMLTKNGSLRERLLKRSDKLPTLAQYLPELFYFEEVGGNLLCSAYSGLPLVRYNLKDQGGILTIDKLLEKIDAEKLYNVAENAGFRSDVWNLPFVYVYERSDFTVKLFGANIYPETVRKALLNSSITDAVTGKFRMSIEFDRAQTQFLQIVVELKDGFNTDSRLENTIQKIIIESLLKENSEYQSNFKEDAEKQKPKIILCGYEDVKYFPPGVKQRWVEKLSV